MEDIINVDPISTFPNFRSDTKMNFLYAATITALITIVGVVTH